MGLGRKTVRARRASEKRSSNNSSTSSTTCSVVTAKKRAYPVEYDRRASTFSTEFEVISIRGDGNCLFRAISHCLYGHEDGHAEIRVSIVNNVVRKWRTYKYFIIGDESYGHSICRVTDYKCLMIVDGQKGGHAELHSASEIFPEHMFRVHRENSDTILDYGSGHIIHDLLFLGNLDDGHFNLLKKNSENLISAPPVKKLKLDECSVTDVRKYNQKAKRRRTSIDGRRELKAERGRNSVSLKPKYQCAVSKIIPKIDPYSIGELQEVCQFCSALYFRAEKNTTCLYTLCCLNGKIKLKPTTMLPEIQHLFTGGNEESKVFRDCIRQYNNSMSFASFGAKVDLPPNKGPYCFKIHGIIHHRISPLYSEQIGNSSYGQLYILDFAKANDIRMAHGANSSLREDTLTTLNSLLTKFNPYARSYRTMHEKIEEERALAIKENRAPLDLLMKFHNEPSADRRRFNDPTISEIAAVFESTDGAPPSHRSINVYQKGTGLQKIDFDSMHCDPMCYPLIWPLGETGWHIEMPLEGARKTKVRETVTMREYVLYRIAVRGVGPAGSFNPVINAGKLTQQIFVDYYCRMEGDRLKYIRREQSKLRVESYVGLTDALKVRAEQENFRVGRIVILPSTFTGSPRNMMQNYQDAMGMVRKFGKPDLFITFTCNPEWPEIKTSVHPWETPNNRPDIVVRVFHAKVKELLRLILKVEIFGKVKSFMYTVEFQKRGLPHIHLLLTLEDDCKFRNPDEIDKVVSAEIPDPSVHKDLYDVVKRHMVHGPCGHLNPSCVCMEDGKCKKDFPKSFNEVTQENVSGYPIYRRRDNGRTILKRINGDYIEVSNQFIVPYNPFLLLYFHAHINVEICSSVRSIKYIHKYIYKGHDCCNIEVVPEGNTIHHDEINVFLNARYVGPTEAAWRIFAYPMHAQSHTVHRLPVHLPDSQNVYFKTDSPVDALISSELRSTQLVAWFKLNSNSATRSPYIYPETPIHYVWVKNCWKKRKVYVKTIGRMYNVSPSDSERYHLRILLLHVVGATSFEDLRTYKNVIYPSFKAATIARGLIINDDEWRRCLEEGSSFQMPYQLRQLFSYICIFQSPSNAFELWELFKNVLSEDFLRIHSAEIAHQLALKDIASTLKLHGFNLSSFDLPLITSVALPQNSDETCSNEEKIESAELTRMISFANSEQRAIINEILNLVNKNDASVCNAYFLDGPGGTGKTFVYRCLIHSCTQLGYEAIAVAWTGIAAMLLPNGRTVHSRFKMPLNLHEHSVSTMKVNSTEARVIRSAKLIIWDEAPMANKHSLMCLNRLLKDIMGNNVPFGGKIIILGGDFRQVLPVVPHASRAATVQNSIKYSPLWQLFRVFKLTKNMRAGENESNFSNFLLEIGNGNYPLSADDENANIIDLPSALISKNDIVTEIYGNNMSSFPPTSRLSSIAILAPKNEHCDEVNQRVLDLLPGVSRTYVSVNNLITEDESELLQFPVEFLNSLDMSGLPPHNLTLKEGAVVMLLRNLNPTRGLLNGTRLIVRRMYENSLDLEVITGTNCGQRVLLPRVDLTPSDTSFPFSFRRRQFPVKLAFCMTINKAQGQTLDEVGVFLPEPCFSHGQLYVALSRAKTFESVKIEIRPQGQRTVNVVWKEVL